MTPNKQQHQRESQPISLNTKVSADLLCVSEMHSTSIIADEGSSL